MGCAVRGGTQALSDLGNRNLSRLSPTACVAVASGCCVVELPCVGFVACAVQASNLCPSEATDKTTQRVTKVSVGPSEGVRLQVRRDTATALLDLGPTRAALQKRKCSMNTIVPTQGGKQKLGPSTRRPSNSVSPPSAPSSLKLQTSPRDPGEKGRTGTPESRRETLKFHLARVRT